MAIIRSSYYRDYGRKLAEQYGINPDLFDALIQSESSWNPSAIPKGFGRQTSAYGFGQILAGTAESLGYSASDRFIPEKNLEMTAKYFAQGLKATGGDAWKAIMYYKSGPGGMNDPTSPSYETHASIASKIVSQLGMTGKSGNIGEIPTREPLNILPKQAGVASPDVLSKFFIGSIILILLVYSIKEFF